METENLHLGAAHETPECAISEWGDWSSCSVSCGTGTKMRKRHYLNPRSKKKCQVGFKTKLKIQVMKLMFSPFVYHSK